LRNRNRITMDLTHGAACIVGSQKVYGASRAAVPHQAQRKSKPGTSVGVNESPRNKAHDQSCGSLDDLCRNEGHTGISLGCRRAWSKSDSAPAVSRLSIATSRHEASQSSEYDHYPPYNRQQVEPRQDRTARQLQVNRCHEWDTNNCPHCSRAPGQHIRTCSEGKSISVRNGEHEPSAQHSGGHTNAEQRIERTPPQAGCH